MTTSAEISFFPLQLDTLFTQHRFETQRFQILIYYLLILLVNT